MVHLRAEQFPQFHAHGRLFQLRISVITSGVPGEHGARGRHHFAQLRHIS